MVKPCIKRRQAIVLMPYSWYNREANFATENSYTAAVEAHVLRLLIRIGMKVNKKWIYESKRNG